MSSSSEDALFLGGEDAQRLREEAQKLRKEIEQFEKKKADMEQEERKEIQAELEEKQAAIDRYSATIPILKPDGSTVAETITFPPRLDSNSKILVCEASLPLGILLGEHESLEGMTEVDEVAAGSNGELAGIQEGDVIRACTACKMEMDQPTWQLLAGGIGRPKTFRYMFSVDNKPFEQVMEAVGSNRLDPEGRPAILVLERTTTNTKDK
mmetsp:Transcript_2235/g.4100  ORF Transcript_2235/g.4100 Transcript_2235/m.4100 type:complete len:210 (+) Transcript_2235:520-1149(+)